MEKPRQVVMQSCPQSVSASLAVALPNLDAVRQTRNYNRKKTLGISKTNPLSRKDIQLPKIMTEAGENFLFHDSGFEENRIIVFATAKNLETMRDFQDWQIDGTFKVCPQLFFQHFTIHCNIYSSLAVMMYALLPNKTQESYGRLFALISHLKPKTVISDFEVAITNAAEIQFSNIKIQYCFFHMRQGVFRKIVEIGCKVRYVEDAIFRHHCELIMSLAFIPPEDLEDSNKCIESSFENEEFDQILDYFEENYIGRIVRGKRRAPRFAILKWNCFHHLLEQQNTTNNSVKAFNGISSQNANCRHPSLFPFMELLEKRKKMAEMKFARLVSGEPAKRKKSEQTAEKLFNLLQRYDRNNIMMHLNGVACNLQNFS